MQFLAVTSPGVDVNASRVLKIGYQVWASFVATNMLNSLKMVCLTVSVTHFLMPGIFPETLAGDAVASSEELLSCVKTEVGLCS